MDLAVLKAAVLGVVEGLTEFVPVSSTGHLIVAERIVDFQDPGDMFTVVIQLGAILAVCVYYAARLTTLARGVVTLDRPALHFVGAVLVASLPAAIVGLLFEHTIDAYLFSPATVAATFVLGGIAIIAIERGRRDHPLHDAATLPWRTAFGIGCCQLLALVPGVSRSGTSILGAMLLGVDRRAATEFSFFLAIPVMVGASGLKLLKHRHDVGAVGGGVVAVGFVVSFVVALGVVRWLIHYVAHRDFLPFAWYRIVAGALLAGCLATGLLTAF